MKQWGTSREAAKALSDFNGREISPDYVRMLASPRYGVLRKKQLDGRTNLYDLRQASTLLIRTTPGAHPKKKFVS